MKVGFIGAGNMGSALMASMKEHATLLAYDISEAACKNAEQKYNAEITGGVLETVQKSDVVFVAIKPQFLDEVFSEIASKITENQVVISMAAGVKIEKLNNFAPKARFIRIMPNVCASIQESMISVCCNSNIKAEELNQAKELLSECGIVEEVPEKLMDCVTAVSGSGPAFVFMFIEAIADAAVRCGMPRQQAYTYAAQTVKGSAELVLQTKKHPAELKDMVCSPAGTTIEGVSVLEENGFRNAVIKAICAANQKSIDLGK